MTKRQRDQKQKPRNRAWNQAMQEVRRSSAASPHRNRSRYYRADDKREARREMA